MINCESRKRRSRSPGCSGGTWPWPRSGRRLGPTWSPRTPPPTPLCLFAFLFFGNFLLYIYPDLLRSVSRVFDSFWFRVVSARFSNPRSRSLLTRETRRKLRSWRMGSSRTSPTSTSMKWRCIRRFCDLRTVFLKGSLHRKQKKFLRNKRNKSQGSRSTRCK